MQPKAIYVETIHCIEELYNSIVMGMKLTSNGRAIIEGRIQELADKFFWNGDVQDSVAKEPYYVATMQALHEVVLETAPDHLLADLDRWSEGQQVKMVVGDSNWIHWKLQGGEEIWGPGNMNIVWALVVDRRVR